MKIELREFQENAVEDLTRKVRYLQPIATAKDPKAIVLSAPTGAGKTIIATAMIEEIIGDYNFHGSDHDTVFLWVTDLPELNNQTYNRMINTSSHLNALNLERIDSSSFDQKYFTPGRVYFLNTQKLGKDKLLTSSGDSRQHTIWETIDNTITERGLHLIVIIDEAHRGMRKSENHTTIIQGFLKGNEVMQRAPLVVGISATPDRFIQLVGISRPMEHVEIDPRDVQNSGLIKKEILLHHSKNTASLDMTLLRVATRQWLDYTRYWDEYCHKEEEEPVLPIFVVQVENAPKGKRGTLTNLDKVISAINEERRTPLSLNAFAHSFDETGPYNTGGRTIRYISPSRINNDREVRVVFFKQALSTGWDCPRAETMISFRKAKDTTYIAQLIGRMVRTPLARTIERDERLNSVSLFLPYYNVNAVNAIVTKLSDPEHELNTPIDVKHHTEKGTLKKAYQTHQIFEQLEQIPSYVIPSYGKIKQTSRLMKLSQRLIQDDIDNTALAVSNKKIFGLLKTKLISKRNDSKFQEEVENKSKVNIITQHFNLMEKEITNVFESETKKSQENINNMFEQSGRNIGEGLHRDFWKWMTKDIDDLENINKVKIEIAILLSDPKVINSTEERAEEIVQRWLSKYNSQIKKLVEGKKSRYDTIKQTAKDPMVGTLKYPKYVEWNIPEDKTLYQKHLYVNDDDEFYDNFNNLEHRILETEINDSIGWLRNPVRKSWSLVIPYKDGETYKSIHPDFLFFRKDNGEIIIDILDPHSHHLEDALSKAKGLAEYGKNHEYDLGRIQIITVIGGNIKRLDLKDKTVRQRLADFTSTKQLAGLYEDLGFEGRFKE